MVLSVVAGAAIVYILVAGRLAGEPTSMVCVRSSVHAPCARYRPHKKAAAAIAFVAAAGAVALTFAKSRDSNG